MRTRTRQAGVASSCWRALGTATLCAALVGCVDEEAQFQRDYTDDYEADRDEDTAQAEEFAARDDLDDLADLDALDDSVDSAAGPRPQALTVSAGPLSILQDDPNFSGEKIIWMADPCQNIVRYDDDAARQRLQEARDLGTDVVRVMLFWNSVIPCADRKRLDRPAFDALRPDRYYVWDKYDTLVRNAHQLGMRVLITFSAPIPYWASQEPAYCAAREQQDPGKFWSCGWKPDPVEYARFVYAASRHFSDPSRFGGRRIWGWTMWNEPNLPGFLGSGEAYTDSGRPRSCLAEDRHCRSLFDTALLYRRLWFTGQRHLRLGDCKKVAVRDGRRTCTRSRVGWVFFSDTANEVANDDVAAHLSYSLCLKAQDVSEPAELLAAKLRARCPEAPRRAYARGVAFHSYATTPQRAAEAVKDVQAGLLGAAQAGRLPAGRGVYVTEDGYRTQVGRIPLAKQGPYIAQAERLLYHAGVRSVAQYELYDEGRGSYDTGIRFAPSAWAPSYQCWMAGQLDAAACAQGADDGTCSDACKALPVARQEQPKPAFVHYQMPVVVTPKGSDVELFVLARAGRANSTLLVEGIQPDGSAVPVGPGVLMVNGRGYGEATFPAAGMTALRVTDVFSGLVRQVALP